MICTCGTELPVSEASVEFTRLHRFYKLDGAFNGHFYELLRQCGAWTDREKGLDRNEVRDLLRLLSEHRKHLGFVTRGQTRGLLGREYGLFDDDARLRVELVDRAGMSAKTKDRGFWAPEKLGHRDKEAGEPPSTERYDETKGLVRRLIPDQWDSVVEEALKACGRLKYDQRGIQAELKWLNANMMERPDFATAPSRTAVKWWLLLNDPEGVEPAVREMLKLMWNKRLAPGDTSGKKKTVAFDEDSDDAETEDREAERMRRLFGDDEPDAQDEG